MAIEIQAELLRRPQVRKLVGLADSTIYDLIRKGRFPRPVRLSENVVAWRRQDLSDWMAGLQVANEGA